MPEPIPGKHPQLDTTHRDLFSTDPLEVGATIALAAFQAYTDVLQEKGYFGEEKEVGSVVLRTDFRHPQDRIRLYTVLRDPSVLQNEDLLKAFGACEEAEIALARHGMRIVNVYIGEDEYRDRVKKYPASEVIHQFSPSQIQQSSI